ncbi:MAG: thioredoxin [Nitrospira sp. HN-bin3]|uniref:thioredoxin family protein n=1 Tax=Nitrospira cf. moscoviensis SBR1015 TaxID=96242 RepID=UPI000A0C9149|nr:thioredoxin family protein [Nitrospira cf. moscoviensis SBR1015]OQW38334.1 MAG: thioredoxin [Nitrospira sp. HN-bin3]
MSKKAVFYHPGCPVCVDAEQNVTNPLDRLRYNVEIVHLGQQKGRITEAEAAGVKSVPALVLDGQPFHVNFGAGLDALK